MGSGSGDHSAQFCAPTDWCINYENADSDTAWQSTWNDRVPYHAARAYDGGSYENVMWEGLQFMLQKQLA